MKKNPTIFILPTIAGFVSIGLFFFAPPLYAGLNLIIFIGLTVIILRDRRKIDFFGLAADEKASELNAVIENIEDGIIIYDTDFKILALNGGGEKILGLGKRQFIGQKITPDFMGRPGFKLLTQILFPSLALSATQVSEENWPQVVEISTDEPALKLKTTLNRIINEAGEVTGFLKIISDETREKNILASKSEFVAVASHQLRTPLTGIKWTFESIVKDLAGDKPELKENLDQGLKLTEEALKTVNDLLDVAKIEEGRFGYKFEKTDLAEFIQEIINQALPIAKEYNIAIQFHHPSETYFVAADRQKLGIAISNLIDNAIRYNAKNGEVAVLISKTENKPFLKISVRDAGIGIPEDEIGKLFTKFYRGSNAVQVAPNGSGLGLYIVKNIIENHGGKINVESAVGRGSTFYFTLPLSTADNQ